jgi:hypothetical protein
MSALASIGFGLAAIYVFGLMLWIVRNLRESVREHGKLTRDDVYAATLIFSVLLLELAGFIWGSIYFWSN